VEAVGKAQLIDMETGTAGNHLILMMPLLDDLLARGRRDMMIGVSEPRMLIDGHGVVVPIPILTMLLFGTCRMAEPGNLSHGGCCRPVRVLVATWTAVAAAAAAAAAMALQRDNGVSLKKGNVFLKVIAAVVVVVVATANVRCIVGAQAKHSSAHCRVRTVVWLVACGRGKPGL
jgi:hypothetical protein